MQSNQRLPGLAEIKVTMTTDCGRPCEARGVSARQTSAMLAGQNLVGWLMGLEPTTTGITIRDSTS